VFPGWWQGGQDGRLLSPNITLDAWDYLLKQNGFSGADLVFRDFEDDIAHHLGWIVARAIGEVPSPRVEIPNNTEVIIIIDQNSKQHHFLAKSLASPIKTLFGSQA